MADQGGEIPRRANEGKRRVLRAVEALELRIEQAAALLGGMSREICRARNELFRLFRLLPASELESETDEEWLGEIVVQVPYRWSDLVSRYLELLFAEEGSRTRARDRLKEELGL